MVLLVLVGSFRCGCLWLSVVLLVMFGHCCYACLIRLVLFVCWCVGSVFVFLGLGLLCLLVLLVIFVYVRSFDLWFVWLC